MCAALHARVGHSRPRTLPHHHGVVLPRRARRHPRCGHFIPPLHTTPPHALRIPHTSSSSRNSAHSARYLGVRRDTIIVYDVSSRESFEALPRWLEELENYVPPEVVKIVVGNKLDKVMQTITRPPPPLQPLTIHLTLTLFLPFLLAATICSPFLGILPPGADVRSGGVRGARGMSLCRGIRQDGRRRDRGIQRRRHAHHRYAFAVERGEARHQDQHRRGATARWKCHDYRRSREHAGEHRPVTGAGRGGVERLFVLAARFLHRQGTFLCLALIIIIFTILTMLVLSCTIPSRRVAFRYDNFITSSRGMGGLLSSFFVLINILVLLAASNSGTI